MARQLEHSFAERLVRLQAEQRLTNEALAREARVSLRLLQKYRNGDVEPRDIWGDPSANAQRLADALQVEVAWLVPPKPSRDSDPSTAAA